MRKITAATANIFGTWFSDCSWICVAAWRIEIPPPTTSPAIRIGNESLIAMRSAPRPRSTASWKLSIETLDQGAHDEMPSVHEDEEQDLERERNEDRRKHEHDHRDQGRRNDEVDDHEREEDREPHDERAPELADHERGHKNLGRDV